MRNGWRAWMVGGLAALMLGGCIDSNQQQIKPYLEAGEVALGGKRYDAAVADANDALKIAPNAQALYLRGRAEEDRPKLDENVANFDWSAARADYQAALDLQPGQPLKADCQAGLANLAFDQGNYEVALTQWASAVDHLDQPQDKAWALYRMGECQQRLGRYQDADQTFQRVVKDYSDQEVATLARQRIGVHGFYVQIGAYDKVPDAQAAMRKAQAAGFSCQEFAQGNGLLAVRGGPYTTYRQAEQAKASVASGFPGAIIGP
jgi:tetratricopeptide (TPR) repeat protein